MPEDVNADADARLTRQEEFRSIYRELRKAARRARRSNPQQTLNTTALVHEAWLKVRDSAGDYNDDAHYIAAAATAMRHILVDYARYHGAACRDRNRRLPLVSSDLAELDAADSTELLALDEALEDLATFDRRGASVVMLRFFAGVSLERAAEVLEVSRRTAARDWSRARAFLATRMAT